MKKSTALAGIAFLAALLFSNCHKEENFGDGRAENLPDSVEIGQSVYFINGESVRFEPLFMYYPSIKLLGCSFGRTVDGISDNIDTAIDSLRTGPFRARLGFDRSRGDGGFENYDQIERDSAFLELTSVNPQKMEVSGRFEARFKKVSTVKFTRKKRYPDEILIQGVFHERYDVPH